MKKQEGRRVYVVVPSNEVAEIDVLKLLSESEIDLSTVTFVDDGEEMPPIQGDDALIVVLLDDHPNEDAVEAIVNAAARAGIHHVVGVWAADQNGDEIHSAMKKYGTAQIPWDPEKLKHELGSDCANVFETPSGDSAKELEVVPNECD